MDSIYTNKEHFVNTAANNYNWIDWKELGEEEEEEEEGGDNK